MNPTFLELTRHTATVPLPTDPSLEGILQTVRAILSRPRVLRVTIEQRKPIEVVWAGREGEAFERRGVEEPLETLLASMEILELPVLPCREALGEAIVQVAVRQLQACHILAAPQTALWQWLGTGGLSHLGGAPITTNSELAPHMLWLFAGASALVALRDAQLAIKINMDTGPSHAITLRGEDPSRYRRYPASRGRQPDGVPTGDHPDRTGG